MRDQKFTSRIQPGIWVVGVAIGYYVAARLGLILAYEQTNASPVWPPAGLAFTAVLVLGYRVWPGITLGAFLANLVVFLANQPAGAATVTAVSFFIAIGNTLEAVSGAALYRAFIGSGDPLERTQDAFRFLLVALLMCFVSAAIGPTSLTLAGFATWRIYGTVWFTWWLGDVASVLILTPLLLSWRRHRRIRWERRLWIEIALLFLALCAVSLAVFAGGFSSDDSPSLAYVLIPVLLWAALRFGSREATTAVALASAVAVWGTVRGLGPFAIGSLNDSLLSLQAYVCILALTVMVLASTLEDRRRVEGALEESRSRLANMFSSAMDAIITVDSEQRVTDFNAAAEQMFRRPAAEALGQPVDRLLPERFREFHRTHIERFGSGGVTTRAMGQLTAVSGLRADGEEFPIEAAISQFSAGGRKYYTVILRDITERRQRVTALRASEAHHRAILESALDCIISIDHEGKVTEFNSAAEKTFGYTRDQALGKTMLDLIILPSLRESHRRGLERFLATGDGPVIDKRIELSGMRADGSEFPLELTVTRIPLDGPPTFTGFVRDITEQKRRASETERMAARLRALSETSNEFSAASISFRQLLDLVARRLSELVGELCVIRLVTEDQQWLETTGSVYHPDPQILAAARQDMLTLPQRVGEGISGRVVATGQALYIPVITTAEVAAQTVPQYRESLERRGVSSLLIVPLKAHGRVIGVVVMNRSRPGNPYTADDLRLVQDLADRAALAIEYHRRAAERAAELARSNAELARSNAELEQFAYVASHDLQEPLRMVTSFLQLLAQRYRGQLDSKADEFIGHAVDGARRMQELISDLLNYSRVGAQGLPQGPTSSAGALQTALDNLKVSLEESAAVVTHEPLPTVWGDATQLTQLFQNLVGNALKFRGQQAPRVHVSAQPNGTQCTFSVQDNGIGFDPQYAERIFQIFQRLHPRRQYPGTGVGLAICKKIVERHGGRIWAESQPGAGSTFHFTLLQDSGVRSSPSPIQAQTEEHHVHTGA